VIYEREKERLMQDSRQTANFAPTQDDRAVESLIKRKYQP
jgi:hypothetical protein